MTILIVLVVVVLLLLFVGALYNGLVRKRNSVDNGWSQIDVQLKRRLDLIPNLVETVKDTPNTNVRLLKRSSRHVTVQLLPLIRPVRKLRQKARLPAPFGAVCSVGGIPRSQSQH